MSNNTLESIDNLTVLDPIEFLSMMKPKQKFAFFNGFSTPLRAPNGFEWFALINRFPTLQQLTYNLYDRMKNYFLDDKTDKSDAGFDLFIKSLGLDLASENIYDIFMKVGPDAAAAFAAVCMDKPGDKTVENLIKTASNEGLVELFKSCVDTTFGGVNIGSFFTERLIDFGKMGGPQKVEALKQKGKLRKESVKSPNRIAEPKIQTA